jgi:hypothetical protein
MEAKVTFRFLTISIACAAALIAQENDRRPEIHGFLSQGYLKTTANNYLLSSRTGSFEYNEAGLTVASQINSKLRVGLQVLSRDLGREGNNVVAMDWAYGDYHWNDCLGFRLGKIKTPYGFYNQSRDVDILRTTILLPEAVYDEDMRDFILSFQGGSVYGDLSVPRLNRLGSFEYEMIGGTLSIPDPNTGYWRWVFNDLAEYVVKSMPPGTASTIKDPSVVGRYVAGGSVRWNTPIQGLRLGYSNFYCRLKANVKMDLFIPTNLALINPIFQGIVVSNIINNMNLDIDITVKKYAAMSAEFLWNDLSLTGEFHSQNYNIDVSGVNVKYIGEGYYGMLTYRLAKWFEMGTFYSSTVGDLNDRKGKEFYKRNLPDYLAWQKDFSVTARFDLFNNWVFKAEAHAVDGCTHVRVLNNPDGMKRYWNLFALKTSYQF